MRILTKIAVLSITSLVPFLAAAGSEPQDVTFLHQYNGGVGGAAYFMNNDPTGNYLFAADIGADAKVTLRNAYYTGGKGGHGTGPTGDALFSQGSIISTKHRPGHLDVVIVVNAGSDTVTVFKINPNRPSELKMLGEPVYSGGNFPNSVAINKARDMVCTLNTGAISGIRCFRLDPGMGLIPLPDTTRLLDLQQSSIPDGPDMTASEVTFTEDDKKLVIAVKGSREHPETNPGFIAIWDVYEDKSLSTGFTRMIGGVYIFSLTQVPGRNAFVSTDALMGAEIYDLDALAQNPSARGRNLTIPGQLALCWSDYSKDTNNYYLVDSVVPSIDEVHLDADLNGSIVAIHQLDKYDGPIDISINRVNGKDRIYLLGANATSVEVFTIQGPGELERIQKLNIAPFARAAGVRFEASDSYGMATFLV